MGPGGNLRAQMALGPARLRCREIEQRRFEMAREHKPLIEIKLMPAPPKERNQVARRDDHAKLRTDRSQMSVRPMSRIPRIENGRPGSTAIFTKDLVDETKAPESLPFDGGARRKCFDLIVAAIGVLLLLPLFGLVAIAIKLDSRGPIFFRQLRYGRGRRAFWIVKFRTMTSATQTDHHRSGERESTQVTRVGHFLRCTHIDELPQLWNVLRGEMSIVGPRPHSKAFSLHFEQQIPAYFRRYCVEPGLTGWAQANGLCGKIDASSQMRMRVEYDLYYVENISLRFDIKIILMTLAAVSRCHFERRPATSVTTLG
jgi:lipopolysaccharide/colanic/teichoic acid biosynthesis glycosyltransferase